MFSTTRLQLDPPDDRHDTRADDYLARRAFVLPWISSAGIVTAIRMFHTAELNYDLTIQLVAARELLNGKGLSTFATTSSNLADPMTLVTLTHFPSGYSLAAAALMLAGATPALVVKLLGAAATLVGWWGWAMLAFAFIGPLCRRDPRWRAIAFAVGALTPLVYTMPWGGTDIFLWAAIPWVLQLLTRSSPSTTDLRSDLLAGAIVGLAVLMRYASLFLAAYALAVILRQSWAHISRLLRRTTAFGLGLAPAVALQVWIILAVAHSAASTGAVPLTVGGVGAHAGVAAAAQRPWIEAPHLATANVALAFWMPGRIARFVTAHTAVGWTLAAVLVVALPALVIVALGRESGASRRRIVLATAAAALLPAVPLFLWVCEAAGATGYSMEPRYYTPLIPLAVPVVCLLAGSAALRATRIGRVCRALATSYILLFIVVSAGRVVLSFGGGPVAMNQRVRLTGTNDWGTWPSFGLTEDGSSARRFVTALLKAEPDAILITNVDHWFNTDPTLDLSRVHPMTSCSGMAADAEVRGPARVFVLASDLGGPTGELFTFGEHWRNRARCFEALQPFTSVRYFPEEELKLLESRIPAGTRVPLGGRRRQ